MSMTFGEMMIKLPLLEKGLSLNKETYKAVLKHVSMNGFNIFAAESHACAKLINQNLQKFLKYFTLKGNDNKIIFPKFKECWDQWQILFSISSRP